MSWQTYIDDSLLGTKAVSKASIHGHDGNPWATSTGFNLSAAEADAIIKGIDNPTSCQANGVYIAGEKYMFLRHEEGRSLYFKKGQAGGCACKTVQSVIIGMYDDGQTPGNCNVTVEKLADYLRDSGY